ncbi:Os12g0196300, partial [Oryza sativa Japonica Group]
ELRLVRPTCRWVPHPPSNPSLLSISSHCSQIPNECAATSPHSPASTPLGGHTAPPSPHNIYNNTGVNATFTSQLRTDHCRGQQPLATRAAGAQHLRASTTPTSRTSSATASCCALTRSPTAAAPAMAPWTCSCARSPLTRRRSRTTSLLQWRGRAT